MAEPLSIRLLDANHAISLPDFATREEISIAWHEARTRKDGGATQLRRVYSAAIGTCTRIGRGLEPGYDGDVLVYGGMVYSHLREHGAGVADIGNEGLKVILAVVEATYPRAVEVTAEKKDSAPEEGAPTAQP